MVKKAKRPGAPSLLEYLLTAAVIDAGRKSGKKRMSSFLVDTTGDGQADHYMNAATGEIVPATMIDTTGDGRADAISVDINGDGRADKYFNRSNSEVVSIAATLSDSSSAGASGGGGGGGDDDDGDDGVVTVHLMVPPGASAGDQLEFVLPGGQKARIIVPPGATGGQKIAVKVPKPSSAPAPAPAPLPQQRQQGSGAGLGGLFGQASSGCPPGFMDVRITLPPGSAPGSALKLNLGGNRIVQATVPPMAVPGQSITLRVPNPSAAPIERNYVDLKFAPGTPIPSL